MVAIRAGAVDDFVRKPDTAKSLVLVYGPDRGLVNERARALYQKLSAEHTDTFSQVRIDAADLNADPARLMGEAQTISLFGGRRVIWVGAQNARLSIRPFEALLEHPTEDAVIIVEAGDLNRTSAVRKRFEACAHAAALPCYNDDRTSINRLIDDVLGVHKCTIDQDARALLLTTLGADRLVSRAEIEKLCLYAGQGNGITPDDVRTATAFTAILAITDFVDAAAGGDAARADALCRRLLASGTNENALASALLRHFQFLLRLRADMDGGSHAAQVVAGARPPVFFKRRDGITRQLHRWTTPRLEQMCAHIQKVILAIRQQSELAPVMAQRLAATIALARG